MSMRINQNVISQSTYSNLLQTSERLETSIGKLSSGLRINSASDDAAGMGISEKMRRQIRGLNRAELNAQDGISLIQTAEGALGETQSIIQRMRELALQSANDTLTSNDRLEIQKEVGQLKQQIDTIAESTEFNTKKLLNGNQSALISTSSDTVNGFVVGNTEGGNYEIKLETIMGGVSMKMSSQILKNKDTGNLAKGNDKLESIENFYSASGEFALASPQILTVTGSGRSAKVTVDSKMTLNELAKNLQDALTSDNGLGVKNSSVAVKTRADGTSLGILEAVSGMAGSGGEFSISGPQDTLDALGFGISRRSADTFVRVSSVDAYGNHKQVDTSENRAGNLIEGIDVKFDSQAASIASNACIVDGLAFDADNVLKLKTGGVVCSIAFNVSSTWSMEGIMEYANEKLKAVTAAATATIVDGELRFTYKSTKDSTATSSSTIEIVQGSDVLGIRNGLYSGFVAGQKDKDKAIQGVVLHTNALTLDITGNQVGHYELAERKKYSDITGSSDMKEISELIISANGALDAAAAGIRVDAVNGSLVFTSNMVGDTYTAVSKVSIAVNGADAGWEETLGTHGTSTSFAYGDAEFQMHVVDTSSQFQIGADKGDNMRIGIADLSTKALGLDKIDLTSVAGAEKSLEKLNQALDRVSAQRSDLGAYQNRLGYSISNLRNTSVNLTSSESRIRDVDIAMEMMEYTRNQIVSQSGISMLAQANALPQNALSLLG